MNRALLLLLFISGLAKATSVPLDSLIQPAQLIPRLPTGNPDADAGISVDTVDGNYWVPLGDGKRMRLSLTGYYGDDPSSLAPHAIMVDLGVVKKARGPLMPAEVSKQAQLAARIGVNCFGSTPAHAKSLSSWFAAQNTKSDKEAQADFGPVHATFSRQMDSNVWITFVSLKRSGTPGQGAWLSTCTLNPFRGK